MVIFGPFKLEHLSCVISFWWDTRCFRESVICCSDWIIIQQSMTVNSLVVEFSLIQSPMLTSLVAFIVSGFGDWVSLPSNRHSAFLLSFSVRSHSMSTISSSLEDAFLNCCQKAHQLVEPNEWNMTSQVILVRWVTVTNPTRRSVCLRRKTSGMFVCGCGVVVMVRSTFWRLAKTQVLLILTYAALIYRLSWTYRSI